MAEFGEVSLITKSSLDNSNTVLAQGGIAAVITDDDDTENHAKDTHIAGAGLCHKDAVDVLVKEASRRIEELIDLGLKFDAKEDGSFDLAREGGHSHHRILHVADETGRKVQETLIKRVKSLSEYPYLRTSYGR